MKHPLSAIVLAHTLAMTMGGAALAQASADINQTGQDNAAYAEQVENTGASIAATIVQSGNNNRAGNPDSGTVSITAGGIWQKGNHGTTTAEVRQSGNSNLGMVTQEGATSKYARVTQMGNSNTGTIAQQNGTGGGVELSQTGEDHRASITLKGNDPRGNSGVVEVVQFGRSGSAEVVQAGTGRTTLTQAGSSNTAKLESPSLVGNLAVEQYGQGNTVSANSLGAVRQYGAGNSAILLANSISLVISPDMYRTAGDIEQRGNNNSASIKQSKSAGDGFATIDQLGSNNTASIGTGGRYSTGMIQIEQQGYANSASIIQNGFAGGSASIEQKGAANTSTIYQTYFQSGQASTVQVGGDNMAAISQASVDEAMIMQDGYRNQARLNQTGDGGTWTYNVARIYQQGNDFQAAIQQNGVRNHAAIRQR